jgi:dynein heavy chain
MKCLFEVNDLAAASPATVSRIGVVYVTSSLLGWFPFVQTWSAITLDDAIPPQIKSHILSRFEEFVPTGLTWQRRYCTEPVETVDIQLVVSLSAIFHSLFRSVSINDGSRTGGGGGDTGVKGLKPIIETGGATPTYSTEEMQSLKVLADKVFAFAYVWSFGASCSETDWDQFDEYVREELMSPLSVNIPPMGRVFDFFVDLNGDAEAPGGPRGAFREWADILDSFSYDPTLPFSQIMVPTVDTRRFSFVITSLIRVMKPVFLTGHTGTGKTVLIQNLLKDLEPMSYDDPNGMGILPVLLSFSAQTRSRETQGTIVAKLEKKRKNLLGAPAGRICVIFVDDVNMPVVETYGAQPPCELLRQFLDHRGFYDREKLFWKDIVDTLMFVGAAPPGGGRQKITPRMSRFCNVLCMPSASDSALSLIFTSILGGFTARFDAAIKTLVKGACDATIELYRRISMELLPTPDKFHCTFNKKTLQLLSTMTLLTLIVLFRIICFHGIVTFTPPNTHIYSLKLDNFNLRDVGSTIIAILTPIALLCWECYTYYLFVFMKTSYLLSRTLKNNF